MKKHGVTKKLYGIVLFSLIFFGQNVVAQETAVKISPLRLLLNSFGATIEHQIRPVTSLSGTVYIFGVSKSTGLFSSCRGTSLELALRKYISNHKKGGIRGFYLNPLIKLTTANCDNFVGGTSDNKNSPIKFYLGTDLGWQAIEKGGFTFDVFVGFEGASGSSSPINIFIRSGLALGFTFGEIIGGSKDLKR